MKIFQGKVAVVTGGSRGIGRAIVLMLAENGAHVAFNYLHSKDKADQLAGQVRAAGVKCLAAQVDIRDFAAVKDWIAQVKTELGGLDIVVNNAGIVRDKPLMMMLEEDWHEVMDTNLHGMFNVTRAAIVTLLKQKSGHVINISSVSGAVGMPGQTNYCASKGGVNSFTKALAKEVAAYGVRVNAVAPGFIETEMLEVLDEARKAKVQDQIPLARLGQPEEVAGCVKFLLSAESSYLIGQIIQIDGGMAIR